MPISMSYTTFYFPNQKTNIGQPGINRKKYMQVEWQPAWSIAKVYFSCQRLVHLNSCENVVMKVYQEKLY